MLGTMSASKATPVTFYVKITLSDTCSPTYHGYYCVRLDLTFNGITHCTAQNCNVTQGTDCYAFTCDLNGNAADNNYGVALDIAYRSPSGTCSTTIGIGSTGFYWYEMATYPCKYAYLIVTL